MLTDGLVAAPRAYWGLYGFGKAGQDHLARSWAAEVESTPLRRQPGRPRPGRHPAARHRHAGRGSRQPAPAGRCRPGHRRALPAGRDPARRPGHPGRVNYRHAFHAGNFADCLKHALLVRLLRALAAKPKPFRVLDTHAGTGGYDLAAPEAARTGEWERGILPAARYRIRPAGRLRRADARRRRPERLPRLPRHHPLPAARRGPPAGLRAAPGGPRGAARPLPPRPPGRRPPAGRLGGAARPDPLPGAPRPGPGRPALRAGGRVRAHGRGHRPGGAPLPRRHPGLLVPHQAPRPGPRLPPALRDGGMRDLIAVEIWLREPTDAQRLNGCGLLVANPPWHFAEEAGAILHDAAGPARRPRAGRGLVRHPGRRGIAVRHRGPRRRRLGHRAGGAGGPRRAATSRSGRATPDRAAAMAATRENARHLPGVALPAPSPRPPTSAALDGAAFALLAMPAQHLRAILDRLPPAAPPLVIAAKGVEQGSLLLPLEIAEIAPPRPRRHPLRPEFRA